jgi:hypothetical protein
VCKDSAEAHKSQNTLRIREQSLGEEVFLYAQAGTQVAEFTSKGEQRSRPLII